MGPCPSSATFEVTIANSADAEFTYDEPSYCQNEAVNPVPMHTTGSTGVFSSNLPGLVFVDVNTGEIDLAGSAPGTYTITNTISSGSCNDAQNVSVQIMAEEDPGFDYGGLTTFCQTDADPVANITGNAGGTFTGSDVALIIVPNGPNAGTIDLDASDPGIYDVTYTTPGTCNADSTLSIEITAPAAPAFSYSAAVFCQGALLMETPVDPFAPNGTFTSTAGLDIVDPNTGEIDIDNSTPGDYTITYTALDACTSPATFDIAILAAPTANAGLDGASCTLEYQLNGNTPATGAGAWSLVSGSGTASFNDPALPNATVTVDAAGTYIFQWEVTNACGTELDETEITFAEPLVLTLGTYGAANCAAPGGNRQITVSGGSGPGNYQYLWTGSGWTDGANTITINETDDYLDGDFPSGGTFGVPGGIYVYKVTDIITGCDTTMVVVIGNQAGLTTEGATPDVAVNTTASCGGGSDGDIEVSVPADLDEYLVRYYDSLGAMLYESNSFIAPVTSKFSDNGGAGLSAGTYYIEVENVTSLGKCRVGDTVTIAEVATPIDITVNSFTDPSCVGEDDGSIDVTVSGGSGTYTTYEWLRSGVPVGATEDITNLEAGDYQLRVTDSNNCSALSEVITLTDPPVAAGPVARDPILTTVSCSAFTARWDEIPGNTYEVDVAEDNGFATLVAGYTAVPVAAGTFELDVNGLTTGQTYFYRVRAISAGCVSDYSNIISVTTEIAPATTAQLATGIACDAFTANWIEVTGADYRVDVAEDNGFATMVATDVLVSAGTFELEVTPLTAGQTYFYRVRAITACGTSANSNTETVTLSGTPVTAPTNVLADNATCTGFDLSWNAVTNTATYLVEAEDPVSGTVDETQVVSDTSYTFTSLSAGVNYNYRITPANNCGDGLAATGNFSTLNPPIALDQTPDVCEDAFGTGVATVDLTEQNDDVDGSASNTVRWFTDAGLTNPVADPTNVTVNNGDIFHAQVDDGTCTNSAEVTYTVNSLDDASFNYASPDYCKGDTNPAPAITTSGGTFTLLPGLAFDDAVGTIDLANSDAGSYNIEYTVGTCGATSTFSITIHDQPEVIDQLPPSVCEDVSGTGQAVVDLTALESDIDNGAGLTVNWYEDYDGVTLSNPIAAPGTYNVSDGEILYAEVVGPTCTNVATVTYTVTPVISAVPAVVASTPTCDGFTLSWNTIAGADDYLIEISDDGFATTLVKDSTTNLSFDVTGLTIGSYSYRVTPGNAGCGRNSATAFTDITETLPAEQCGCGFDQASFNVVPTDASCIGANDGQIQVFTSTSSTAPPSRFRYKFRSLSSTDSSDWQTTSVTLTGIGIVVFDPDTLTAGQYEIIIEDINASPSCLLADTIPVQIGVQNDIAVNVQAETCDVLGAVTISNPGSCESLDTYDIYPYLIGEDGTETAAAYIRDNQANGSVKLGGLLAGSYRIIIERFNATTGDFDSLTTLQTIIPNNCSNSGGEVSLLCNLGDKTVSVDATDVSCDTGEGEVTLTVIGGEDTNYIFTVVDQAGAVNETITAQGAATFVGLPAGLYDYTVTDAAGTPRCQSRFTIAEKIVVLSSFDYTLPGCEAPEQVAELSIVVDTLRSTASAPYDVFAIQGTDTVSTTFIDLGLATATLTGLPTGEEYKVVVQSRAAETCPGTQTVSIPETGEIDISFDFVAQNIMCFGDGAAVTINNIVVAEDEPFSISLYRSDQTEPYATRLFSIVPTSYTFADLEIGDYQIQVEQQQSTCGILSTGRSETFNLEGPVAPLNAEVEEIVRVSVNDPVGDIAINNITGGGVDYEVRIAVDPEGNTQDWIEVVNDNPAINPYEHVFTEQERGFYVIEVRDRFGCTLQYTVEVRYTEELYIPNIFTPNGDGENDTFRIVNLDDLGDENGAKMIITSRWGRIIYRSDHYTNAEAWDGEEYPDGIYFYQLILPSGEKNSGWVEIWRGRTP
ncbi:MAG: fibronectin type III domain-containing protein [Cyclobacteriaceae bacterium]